MIGIKNTVTTKIQNNVVKKSNSIKVIEQNTNLA
jgi:hypothetical protein